MAVAFGSVVNVTPTTGSNTGASPSITTPTTNPVVLVYVGLAHATAVVNSLTITGFGGTAAEVGNIRATGGATLSYCSIWVIKAPTANTAGTVQANLSASVPFQMAVCTFSGADQTDPCPTGDVVKEGDDSPATQTLTPTHLTANDATGGMEGNSENQNLLAITPNGRYLSNSTAINMAAGDATGTTGLSVGNDAGAFWTRIAVRIVEATAPAGATDHIMNTRFIYIED